MRKWNLYTNGAARERYGVEDPFPLVDGVHDYTFDVDIEALGVDVYERIRTQIIDEAEKRGKPIDLEKPIGLDIKAFKPGFKLELVSE
jgi:hypothetical protein